MAAKAPTVNYAFDVYYTGGLLSLDPRVLLQEYLLAPLWMGLVWAAHAVLVMLEWCYSIDLLSGSSASVFGRGLRETQATFTQPWLVLMLALASVLALYHGLVRRQVAQTVGQAVLMLAMMAAGLWVIMSPAGTVGVLASWADQASRGTLGAVAQGTPSAATRTLTDGMRAIFADGIEAPWCYMEFGDVQWCRDPARLDAPLHAAALRLAAGEQALIGCRYNNSFFSFCVAPGGAQARAYEASAELLRRARTNGELFLAFAPNRAPRNSIDGSGALLRVLCGSSDIRRCHGPTTAQAQFRTAGATSQRAAGLLLILLGAVGMILLLGFLALHLLGAAILSLFYLLLAPAAVLAPALGDVGRAAFRGWATRLFGAVVSKLLFSLLLGAVLAMVRILLSLPGLGWWTQWLLVSALWWGAYRNRHQLLGFVQGEHRQLPGRRSTGVAARVREALQTPREIVRGAGWVKGKFSKQAPDEQQRKALTQAGHQRAQAHADEQVDRTLQREHRAASAYVAAAPQIQSRLASKQSQLGRVRSEHGKAVQSGDARRAARLGFRAQRIEGEIAQERQRLSSARHLAAEGEQARRRGGQAYTREQHEERARFLDAQAALPPAIAGARAASWSDYGDEQSDTAHIGSGAERVAPTRRDYAALASLADYGPQEYQRLDPYRQRQARLKIDRELALRRELNNAAEDVAPQEADQLGRRQRRRLDRSFDKALEQRLKDNGQHLPVARRERSKSLDSWLAAGHLRTNLPDPNSSTVMRDAREVAQRRKRQLGARARR